MFTTSDIPFISIYVQAALVLVPQDLYVFVQYANMDGDMCTQLLKPSLRSYVLINLVGSCWVVLFSSFMHGQTSSFGWLLLCY
jgi:hypothetical protein